MVFEVMHMREFRQKKADREKMLFSKYTRQKFNCHFHSKSFLKKMFYSCMGVGRIKPNLMEFTVVSACVFQSLSTEGKTHEKRLIKEQNFRVYGV